MATIYAIECANNGRVYVGCATRRLNRRLNEHRSRCKKKIHTVIGLMDDYDRYGAQAFSIRVLEKLPDGADIPMKREAELRWMRIFKNENRLYNEQLISFQPGAGYKLRSHTPEANNKRRMTQLGKAKREGQGAKISATKKALGQKPTLEAARLGALACHKVRYGKTDEIVSSASKKEDAGRRE